MTDHGTRGAIIDAKGLLEQIAHVLELAATGIDLFGIALLLFGFAVSFAALMRKLFQGAGLAKTLQDLTDVRLQLGVYILVAVEFMIVSDIIHTVISRRLEDLAFVAALVAIRSAISFFLGRELADARREAAAAAAAPPP